MEEKNKITTANLEWSEGKIKGFFGKGLFDAVNGGIKLVRIISGAVYPSHIHPDKTEYAYVLEGTLVCRIEGKEFGGNTGDFFLFPAGAHHALSNQSNEDCVVLIGSVKK